MKLLTALSGAALALSLLASPAAAASDLPTSYGFYDEVTYLMEKGVISGYPDGTIKPDKVVTRAEAAIMIGKLRGFEGKEYQSSFSDVPASMKASGYIAEAQKAGYISGYGDGTYKPNAPITRGDMAIILSRVFETPIFGISDYTDVTSNMKAYEAIHKVTGANIAAGYADGTFKPTAATTRGQFSAFLARGLMPKFQNDTHMAHSYLRDKTKAYSYQYDNGDIYTDTYEAYPDYGFAWTDNTGTSELYHELESTEFYGIAYDETVLLVDLVYPIAVGTVVNEKEFDGVDSKITGVDITVKTAYKTFTNAVEVTVYPRPDISEPGYKYYMVEGYGHVKVVQNNGDVTYELIAVK